MAGYYDLSPHHPADLSFYLARLNLGGRRVLELGAGTGRVSIPLAQQGAVVFGVDSSPTMLARCRAKAEAVGLDSDQATFVEGDITDLNLGRTFDLIIAPFRVIQNLETDEQLEGLFDNVRSHLAPDGRCILNVFNPNRDPEEMRRSWVSGTEQLAWEVPTPDGRVACFDFRRGIDREKLVLYPRLIYRTYTDDELVDEAVLDIAMRCFYPQEFVERIEDAGFRVIEKWGGYADEVYGEGPELVVEFGAET